MTSLKTEEEIKQEVENFVKTCCLSDMYDIFDICRERHNSQMLKNR